MKSMLKSILGTKPEQDVEAVVAAATAALQADFDSFKATAEELLAAETEQLTEAKAALAEAATLIETLQAEVATLKGETEKAVVDAETMRKNARLAKITEAIGTASAAALMAATEALDDAAFEAVVSALNGKTEAEAKSALFTEVGVAAEVDTTKVTTEESAEMKLLKAKYAQK